MKLELLKKGTEYWYPGDAIYKITQVNLAGDTSISYTLINLFKKSSYAFCFTESIYICFLNGFCRKKV